MKQLLNKIIEAQNALTIASDVCSGLCFKGFPTIKVNLDMKRRHLEEWNEYIRKAIKETKL